MLTLTQLLLSIVIAYTVRIYCFIASDNLMRLLNSRTDLIRTTSSTVDLGQKCQSTSVLNRTDKPLLKNTKPQVPPEQAYAEINRRRSSPRKLGTERVMVHDRSQNSIQIPTRAKSMSMGLYQKQRFYDRSNNSNETNYVHEIINTDVSDNVIGIANTTKINTTDDSTLVHKSCVIEMGF